MTGFSERIKKMATTQKNDEIACDLTGFTYSEIKILRTLVSDRIENRFAYAAKVSAEMNLDILRTTTDELNRLAMIKSKLMEEIEDD